MQTFFPSSACFVSFYLPVAAGEISIAPEARGMSVDKTNFSVIILKIEGSSLCAFVNLQGTGYSLLRTEKHAISANIEKKSG